MSGTAGTGKTTLAAHFVDAACRARREVPVLPVRGIAAADDAQHALGGHRPRARGWTRACCSSMPTVRTATASRPTCSTMHHAVERVQARRGRRWIRSPTCWPSARHADVRAMLTRVIDYLKTRGITALFTSLTTPAQPLEHTETADLLADGHLDPVAIDTVEDVAARAALCAQVRAACRTRTRCASSASRRKASSCCRQRHRGRRPKARRSAASHGRRKRR